MVGITFTGLVSLHKVYHVCNAEAIKDASENVRSTNLHYFSWHGVRLE